MLQIAVISKSSMRNGVHFTFIEAFIALMKREKLNVHADSNITDKFYELTDAFSQEDVLFKLSSGSPTTQDLSDADRRRDRAWGALKTLVSALIEVGSAEQQAAAAKVSEVLKNYSVDVNAAFDQESALLTNALTDLDALGTELSALHVENIVANLKTANEEVKRLLAERNKERSGNVAGALKAAREQVDGIYDSIVRYVNAFNVLSETAEFDSFIAQWNTNIDRVRKQDFPSQKEGSVTAADATPEDAPASDTSEPKL